MSDAQSITENDAGNETFFESGLSKYWQMKADIARSAEWDKQTSDKYKSIKNISGDYARIFLQKCLSDLSQSGNAEKALTDYHARLDDSVDTLKNMDRETAIKTVGAAVLEERSSARKIYVLFLAAGLAIGYFAGCHGSKNAKAEVKTSVIQPASPKLV